MEIMLPVTEEDLPLRGAWNQMVVAGTSGIVWQHEGKFLLYRASDVVIQQSNGKKMLSELAVEEIKPVQPKGGAWTLEVRSISPGASLFTIADSLAPALQETAAQCYCPGCGLAGQQGKLCPIDQILPVCS